MADFDIHIVAGVVRSFLLSLKSPIITSTLRESFVKLSYIQEVADTQVVKYFYLIHWHYLITSHVLN